MRQVVKDYLNEGHRTVFCPHLYKISGGYASEGGDYDAAQRWLAANGYRYVIEADGWVSNAGR